MNELSRDNLKTELQHLIHSMILEASCDISDTIVKAEYNLPLMIADYGDGLHVVDGSYVEPAQDLFNDYQSDIEEQLYSLANSIIKLIPTPTAKTREDQLIDVKDDVLVDLYCETVDADFRETMDGLQSGEISDLELIREIIEIENQR